MAELILDWFKGHVQGEMVAREWYQEGKLTGADIVIKGDRYDAVICDHVSDLYGDCDSDEAMATARLFAASPALLSEVGALRERVAELEGALKQIRGQFLPGRMLYSTQTRALDKIKMIADEALKESDNA